MSARNPGYERLSRMRDDYAQFLKEVVRTARDDPDAVNGSWLAEIVERADRLLRASGDGPYYAQKDLDEFEPDLPEPPTGPTPPVPEAVAHAPAWVVSALGMEALVRDGPVVNEGGPAAWETVPGTKRVRAVTPAP